MKRKNNFINQPTYPGGLKALRQYVKDNLVYPKEALENKIQGSVHVQYVVNETGKVISAKAMHGLGHGCEEEAIRLVKSFKFNVKKTRGLKLKHNKSIKIHFRLGSSSQAKVKQSAQPITQISYTTTTKKEVEPKSQQSGGYGYEIEF